MEIPRRTWLLFLNRHRHRHHALTVRAGYHLWLAHRSIISYFRIRRLVLASVVVHITFVVILVILLLSLLDLDLVVDIEVSSLVDSLRLI